MRQRIKYMFVYSQIFEQKLIQYTTTLGLLTN